MKLTLAAALAGAADAASFGYSRRERLRTRPARAVGTVVSVGLWTALAASAAADRRGRARALGGATVAVNGAMLAIHVRAGIASPRVWLGSGLAVLALTGTAGGSR